MSGELDVVLHIEATSSERIHKLWEEVAVLQGIRHRETTGDPSL
jgi:Lrp/AsnC family transcriptional regulator, leucine-responsive regulatory protein